MRKQYVCLALSLLLIPLILCICTFALPAQYDDTFLGELRYKRELLAVETENPRIILVGGSAVAFGVDSALMEEVLPDYEVINDGLYAALGTRVMLDLSMDDLREGDIVIVIPEQQAQALSDYLGADAMWQASDGDFSALLSLHGRDVGKMLAAWPGFAISKLRYALHGKPEPVDIYRRDSFNAKGDIASDLQAANVMPDGYDPIVRIDWDPDLPTAEFCQTLRDYSAAAAEKGAVVWYHFAPMNAAAMQDVTEADMDAYAAALCARIDVPLAGDPRDCVMESGWFYDTNFHLNASGRTVYTRQLIRDIKAMLGDSTSTEILIPEMPDAAYVVETAADNDDAAYFLYESTNDGTIVTGLTPEGRRRTELTVPGEIEGQVVTSIDAQTFQGAAQLTRVTIQENITSLPDGLFAGCHSMQEVRLLQERPSRLLVGQALLDDAPDSCQILVPEGAYTDYCVSYAWSAYAGRIRANCDS